MTPIYNRLRVESPQVDTALWDAHIDFHHDAATRAEGYVRAAFGWWPERQEVAA